MTSALEKYNQLVKGFIHEANEAKEVVEHNNAFLVRVHNIEYDSHTVIIINQRDKSIPYNMSVESEQEAIELFNGLSSRIGAKL